MLQVLFMWEIILLFNESHVIHENEYNRRLGHNDWIKQNWKLKQTKTAKKLIYLPDTDTSKNKSLSSKPNEFPISVYKSNFSDCCLAIDFHT